MGRVDEALKTLAELEARQPTFSRLYEERGQCYVAMRQAQPAIAAFLAAVNRNNALPASWGMLEGLYRMAGDGPARAPPPVTWRLCAACRAR